MKTEDFEKEVMRQSIDWRNQGVMNLAHEPDIFINITHGNISLHFRCPSREQPGTLDGCIYKRLAPGIVPGDADKKACVFETHCSGCTNRAAQDTAIATAARFILSQAKERVLGL